MKLAVVAGEASGDLHAADVIRELRRLVPSLETFGIGGDLLAREGMEILHHAREMGIVGLFNVLRHLPHLRRVFDDFVKALQRERPDAVLLVDYPGFNLRVARSAHELGIPVVYYISPQLWAWRKGRVRDVAKYVDRMIVLFPFEETFYRDHGVAVTYVGHPLVEQLESVKRPPRNGEALRVALLPGSRGMEVRLLLPRMLDAVAILGKERAIDAYVVLAPTIAREKIEKMMMERQVHVPIIEHDHGQSVAAADVAICSSGTATLEAAILGTPTVVVYRLSRATYFLAKWLVRLPHFSLVNIVAGKTVVPELIQNEVNGPRIARAVHELIEPETYQRVSAELAAVKDKLGTPGASRRAAEEIIRLTRGSGS
jgi:lipid-A-disaccharide synthase